LRYGSIIGQLVLVGAKDLALETKNDIIIENKIKIKPAG
jgi:hypothetical protein